MIPVLGSPTPPPNGIPPPPPPRLCTLFSTRGSHAKQTHAGNPNPHHTTGGSGGTSLSRPTPQPQDTTTGRGKQPTTTPHHREGEEEPLGGGRGGGPAEPGSYMRACIGFLEGFKRMFIRFLSVCRSEVSVSNVWGCRHLGCGLGFRFRVPQVNPLPSSGSLASKPSMIMVDGSGFGELRDPPMVQSIYHGSFLEK